MRRGTFTFMIASIAAITFVILIAPAEAFCQSEAIAGIVKDVHGPVSLKQGKNDKTGVKLDSRYDKARLLFVDQEIYCGPGGVIYLSLCNGDEYEDKEIQGPGGYTISPANKCRSLEELKEYARLGGRDRGSVSPIFSPANDSVVKPDTLVIRWVAGPKRRASALEIISASAGVVWQHEIPNVSSGTFSAEDLRQTLVKLRDRDEPLLLRFRERSGTAGAEGAVTFSLLSVNQEQQLQQELSAWDKKAEGMLRRLGRASIFVRHLMFIEAAEEYEGALELAPKSRDLLNRTIRAQLRTGNSLRVQELRLRLGRLGNEP
jgi:hypothetical protein